MPVRVLWAVMIPTDLQPAKEALRDRENISGNKWMSRIGSWQEGDPVLHHIPELPEWARARGLNAVIWTALGPKFQDKEMSPSAQQVVEYLQQLTGTVRDDAERYVRCAPRQIDTEYRRRIEATLGWSCRECGAIAV